MIVVLTPRIVGSSSSSRCKADGRMLVTKTSAALITAWANWRPLGVVASAARLRRERLCSSNRGLRPSADEPGPLDGSPVVGSSLMTEAPQLARTVAQEGPAA